MIKFHPAAGGITVELTSEENGRTVSSREFVPFDQFFHTKWAMEDAWKDAHDQAEHNRVLAGAAASFHPGFV